MKSDFQYSIENFRGLAILFVIFSHLQFASRFENARTLEFFFGNATVFFIFISGFLFYWTEQARFSYFKFLSKKAKVVVLPYIIVSIPSIWYGIHTHKNVLIDLTTYKYILWSYLVGGTVSGQLWFVPMIICFFLLTPIFIYFGRAGLSKPAVFFTATLLSFSLFTSRPFANLNPFLSTINFSGFYALAVLIASNYSRFLKYSWPITLISSFVFIGTFFFIPNGDNNKFFLEQVGTLNIQNLSKLAMTLMIFMGFAIFFNKKNFIFSYLAKISFGLFFVHTNIRFLFYVCFGQISDTLSPLSYAIFEISFVILVSILVVELIRYLLKKRSQYVIGC